MAVIRIAGGSLDDTAEMFEKICRINVCDMPKLLCNIATPCYEPEVMLVQSETEGLSKMAASLDAADYLVVNADQRGIFPALSESRARIITYGFNGKACVTASSVDDGRCKCCNSLQVCIQRGFRTLSGGLYEPQEFRAEYPPEMDAHTALAAAARV